jgi:hypothetical protein
MARTDQGLWVGSPLPSWKGKCGCRRSKLQASMQPPHNQVSPFLLWSQRTKSPSCSTWQIEQHSPYSNHQRRCHSCTKMDVGMGHLRQRLELGEAQCFRQDADGVLWFKDHLVVPKDFELRRKIMDEAHCSWYSINREPTRCIKIWRRIYGGWEWSERLWSMCPNVTHVEESRPIIWDPLETCNPWAFPSGNGKIFVWTSLWVCLAPHVVTTRYGSSWTAWLSQPTSYPYPPPTGSDSMPSSSYHLSRS